MTSPLQQKIRVKGPVVATANRLGDGVVIYWTKSRTWTRDLQEAHVVSTSEAATALLQDALSSDEVAIGTYIAPVRLVGSQVLPGNLREQIRLDGLTFALPQSFGI